MIRKKLTIVLFAALVSTALHAESIDVAVDNVFIQTFRGKPGIWTVPGKDSFEYLLKQYGSSKEEVLSLNGGKFTSQSYMFFPYSETVLKQVLADGKGRRIQKVDPTRLMWPIETPVYTSRYGNRGGERHPGLDFGCARNTVVVAADTGVVVRAGWMGGLGLAVAIQHANGNVTWYAHNTAVLLSEGEHVNRGQIVAYSGSTGRSTGPHVHFEVRFMDVPLDPEDFIQFGLVRPDLVVREGPQQALSQEVSLDNVVMNPGQSRPGP
ncbi:MAG: M23 family metallopeptidase [Leptospirales bacterium]|nr:M23 family metallopeptidase [Leptospirales bacterium]HMW61291.1 M23 family metallopeptidase [Leptospiraceae bacterium]